MRKACTEASVELPVITATGSLPVRETASAARSPVLTVLISTLANPLPNVSGPDQHDPNAVTVDEFHIARRQMKRRNDQPLNPPFRDIALQGIPAAGDALTLEQVHSPFVC